MYVRCRFTGGSVKEYLRLFLDCSKVVLRLFQGCSLRRLPIREKNDWLADLKFALILWLMTKLTLTLVLMLACLAGMSQTGTDTAASRPAKPAANVDSSATFPGGDRAWSKFLVKNLRFPQATIDDVKRRQARQWTVIIRFTVTTDGTVKDVVAETNHGGGLEEEAIRLIKKSGKWIPATRNGVPVESYKRQPIVFALEVG